MPSAHQTPTYSLTPSTPSSPASESEIYSVAKVAYSKLVSEAALKDQNLRRLVGHANLYDKLLDEYNNCFSDSESDTESVEEEDVDEFASQAYYSTPVEAYDVKERNGEVEIYGEESRGVVTEEEVAVLRKVASHSENLGFHALGSYAEVEVRELEDFED